MVTIQCISFVKLVLFIQWAATSQSASTNSQYCVVGSGPAGLQMGYFLSQSQRDYVIIDKCDVVGCFFVTYPRHRTLISINKRFTGSSNKMFNERHDWNSLLTHDESLKFTNYSTEFFPHADDLVHYMQDYSNKHKLNIKLKTEVENITRNMDNTYNLQLMNLGDQSASVLNCEFLIMATGISRAKRASWFTDDILDYSTMPIEKTFYDNKNVVIFGSGNSAFETADYIGGNAASIHIVTQENEIALSWQTHYVGNVRAINQAFLDTYQLKSLNGIINRNDIERLIPMRNEAGQIRFTKPKPEFLTNEGKRKQRMRRLTDEYMGKEATRLAMDEVLADHWYDVVISCIGLTMNTDFFDESTKPQLDEINPKFAALKYNFESVNNPNMFFIGVPSHSLDRNSSGGFIHGFRYQIHSFHKMMEQRNHGIHWPHRGATSVNMLALHMMKRMNTAAAPYQMFHYLCDVILRLPRKTPVSEYEYVYLNDYPLPLLSDLISTTGIEGPFDGVMIWYFDYGHQFSCVGCNTLREKRARVNPDHPERANFLHPILQQWQWDGSTDLDVDNPPVFWGLTENFHTKWTAKLMFGDYLTEFLYDTWEVLSSHEYIPACFGASLENNIPSHCPQVYTELQSFE